MFDDHARAVIAQLPQLPSLDPVECRRALTRAYLLLVEHRLQSRPVNPADEPFPTLRKMVTALESVAVFDPLQGVEVLATTRDASAFAAAEALSLLLDIQTSSGLQPRTTTDDPIRDAEVYQRLESSLLYMIGGFDINAVAVAAQLPSAPAQVGGDRTSRAGLQLLNAIAALCRGQVRPYSAAVTAAPSRLPPLLSAMSDEVRARLYDVLTEAVDSYRGWLAGDGDADMALALIERVRSAVNDGMRDVRVNDLLAPRLYSDVYHLASLLAAAIAATRQRAIVDGVPPPVAGEPSIISRFNTYLAFRARGNQRLKGRPLLWPSTQEYIAACMPGPHRDAVVSMPTGSGKSFLAELAVVHALARGWVLYLAPTNALAHQIRRDLQAALSPFADVTVTAFVGGAEYSTLASDAPKEGLFVGVMTPEKCALALRLYRDAFGGCALCVFDECHLLNDANRGTVADVLMSQLFGIAKEMRVLMMSAMVANATELAEWLTTIRGDAVPSRIAWRPSRAARGLVFVDRVALDAAAKEMTAELAESARAQTLSREIPMGALAGLSGPWTREGAADYGMVPLPLSATLKVSKSRKGIVSKPDFESWKNVCGRSVAEMLARKGMAAIDFVLSSRHHAFGQAAQVTEPLPDAPAMGRLPGVVEAQLAVAAAELGVPSALHELLTRGVAVHTSAMLQVEQAAAEHMFAEGSAKLIFATGTLAQGLNLPAVAVVVSGSKVGDPRDVDFETGLTRSSELILNGFGRAGRPGFANQGVVLLVSDTYVHAPMIPDLNGASMINSYPVLAQSDASVNVRSPVERFLDEILVSMHVEGATELELTLAAQLAAHGEEDDDPGKILLRTFAAFRKRATFGGAEAAQASQRIASIKREFLEQPGVPRWMTEAAARAGVDFFRARRMWEAYTSRGLADPAAIASYSVEDWFGVLSEVLMRMPVAYISGYMDDRVTQTPGTVLRSLAAGITGPFAIQSTFIPGWEAAWRRLAALVHDFMKGATYRSIAARLLGVPIEAIAANRNDGARGIPPVFKFIGDVVDRTMSIDAGCLLALHECWLAAEHPDVPTPEALQALPICVRYGCNNLDVLAWFRFGLRQRACAHALATAFPMPEGVKDDEGRKSFVMEQRRVWLDTEVNVPSELLDFARIIVTDGQSERS